MEENISVIRGMLEELVKQPRSQVSEENEIMSVKQLAPFLGIDATIIYAKCGRGEIPYFKLGKQYRFRKAEIIKWLKEQKEDPSVDVDDYVAKYLQRNTLKS